MEMKSFWWKIPRVPGMVRRGEFSKETRSGIASEIVSLIVVVASMVEVVVMGSTVAVVEAWAAEDLFKNRFLASPLRKNILCTNVLFASAPSVFCLTAKKTFSTSRHFYSNISQQLPSISTKFLHRLSPPTNKHILPQNHRHSQKFGACSVFP